MKRFLFRNSLKLIQNNSKRNLLSSQNSFLTKLDETGQAFQEAAHDFAMVELLPNANKWDGEKIFPIEQMRTGAALGFAGLYVDAEYEGGDVSRLYGNVVFEMLAMGCPSTAAYISIHNMCGWMINEFGNHEQKVKYLVPMVHMEDFASYCLTEANAGSDAASLRTTAVKKGDKYILNGEKMFISGAGESNTYLIMARTGDKDSGAGGISCFIVEKDFPGISFGKNEKKLGWNCQPTRTVILENCEVPQENLLGVEGQGFKIAMAGLDSGRLSIASCSLGGAQHCLNQTIHYTKGRKQFGTSIMSFQNTQFEIAKMQSELEAARLLVREACIAVDENAPDKTVKCSMAKYFATDRAYNIVDRCLQLHGGYGYLNEYGIERYLRDLRVHRILEGTNEIQLKIIARALEKDNL